MREKRKNQEPLFYATLETRMYYEPMIVQTWMVNVLEWKFLLMKKIELLDFQSFSLCHKFRA